MRTLHHELVRRGLALVLMAYCAAGWPPVLAQPAGVASTPTVQVPALQVPQTVATQPGVPVKPLPPSCDLSVLHSTEAKAPELKVIVNGVDAKEPNLKMGDMLELRFAAGDAFATCVAATDPVLHLDHLPLVALKPRGKFMKKVRKDEQQIVIAYRLEERSGDADVWKELRRRAWVGRVQPVDISLGVGGAAAAVRAGPSVQLHVGWSGFSYVVGAATLCVVVLVLIAAKGNVVRDRTSSALMKTATSEPRSFSLSRLIVTTWALTTMVVVAVQWLHAGSLPNLAEGGLPLLLLASGLTVGTGAVVDYFRKTVAGPSEGLVRDLLADDDGIVVHRLQAMLFSLLVLWVFWHELATQGTVANLDKGWALLMGISASTYLYGKTTERTPSGVTRQEVDHGLPTPSGGSMVQAPLKRSRG
jgi:hypothetical protein